MYSRGGRVAVRRLQVRLTSLAGAIVISLVIPLAWVVADARTANTYAGERDSAIRWVAETAARQDLDSGLQQSNTWLIDADDDTTSLGTYDFEPSTDSLADSARAAGLVVVDHRENEAHFLAVAEALPAGRVLVGAWSLTTADAVVRRGVWITVGVAAGVAIGLVAMVWLIAGMALRSVRRAQLLQRDFLAHAAHELRTPLAVVQSAASHALVRPRTAEDYAASLAEIRTAVEGASRSVAQFLDLARFDTGTVELDRVPVRLDLLAEEIVATWAAGGSKVVLSAVEPVVVDANDGLLRQALDNLVRNAAPRAETVAVEVVSQDGRVTVTVSDDGPGFDPDFLPLAFERFARTASGHHGIGLALVKTIVTLHGGKVEAANRPTGGAELRVTLPWSVA
jgi:signal transduction histidine kinase